jgi:predicted enzyme related to lactoylglutathione lyase
MAFVPTKNPDQAKAFYQHVLRLELKSENFFALVFDANGIMLRVTTVKELTPQPFTILGWTVDDIATEIKELKDRGVSFEIYKQFQQDELGIFTFPDGAKVAWFKDPDGNVLSLTQFP